MESSTVCWWLPHSTPPRSPLRTQVLHGGFEARLDAGFNINPHALGYDQQGEGSAYPAQVLVQKAFQAEPVHLQTLVSQARDLFYSLGPPKMQMHLSGAQVSASHWPLENIARLLESSGLTMSPASCTEPLQFACFC